MNKLLSLLLATALSTVALTATAATGPSLGGSPSNKIAPPPPAPASKVQATPTTGTKTGPSLQAAPPKTPASTAPTAPPTPFPSKTK